MPVWVYIAIAVLSLWIALMIQQYVIWPLMRRSSAKVASDQPASMSATQLHIKICVLVVLAAIGSTAIAAPLFAVLGSGKVDGLRHPAVISMMVFGASLLVLCVVLAGRLAGKAMPEATKPVPAGPKDTGGI